MLILLTLCVTNYIWDYFPLALIYILLPFEEYNQDILYPIQNKKFKVNLKKIFTRCRDSVWFFSIKEMENIKIVNYILFRLNGEKNDSIVLYNTILCDIVFSSFIEV